MSKKEETVTIEWPVSLLDACEHGRVSNNITEIQDILRAARLARKSKYERWREAFHTVPAFWEDDLDGETRRSSGFVRKPQLYYSRNEAKLMAAAPQLLEALIGELRVHRAQGEYGAWPDYLRRTKDAIRAALPKDVAHEVLDD